MEQVQWANVCCNPFNKPGHSYKKKNLRPILPWMLEKFPSLTQGGKICDRCRKQLAVESNLDESCDDDVDSSYACQQDQLESINECLKAIGETPVVKSWSVQKLQEEFGVSNYMARIAKDLVKNQEL